MDFSRQSDQPHLPGLRAGFPPSAAPRSHEYPWPPQRSISTSVEPTYYPDHPRAVYEPDPDIYEPIYDSRWRLLNQEAARLQRDNQSSKSPTPASSLSSRESSLGPSGGASVLSPSPSFALLSDKSSKLLRIPRRGKDFGFTLRHFIVYPPEDDDVGEETAVSIKQPMESIFVKGIKSGGPADVSGLQKGDRILSVNGVSVEKKSYSEVIQLIQATGEVLELVVVPRQDDMLQIYFSEIAQNPETNQRKPSANDPTSDPWTSLSRYPSTVSATTNRYPEVPCYEPVCFQPHPSSQVFQQLTTSYDHLESSRTLHYRSRDGTYAISHSNDSLPDHAYAVPARVIEMSESLTSLESGSTGFTSFPSTPVYEGNNSSQPTSLSSRGNQFGQQDYFSGHPRMNHQLNQPRPNSVSQRPLPPIPLKSSEHVRPLAAPTMASTRRKVSTGEHPLSRPDDARTRSGLTESTSRVRSAAYDPNRRSSLADNTGSRQQSAEPRNRSAFSPEHAGVSTRLTDSSGRIYSEPLHWKEQGQTRVSARSCSQRSFNVYGTPTDYRVPKTQQQSPEKIVRPCRENVRTQNTDNSSAGNARQIRPNETKENMREAAATLLNKNQKDNVRQSPLRTRETTANVRQKPFRPKDMENVRHITSVIIERTPERSTEEPVYSTVSESAPTQSDSSTTAVIRKNKRPTTQAESDEMNLRRISYLMATKDDRMQPGSDIEEEEEEFIQVTSTDSKSCTDGTKQTHHGVHKILSVFGKKSDFPTSPKLGDQKRKESNEAALMPTATSNDVVKEGLLDVLVSSTDGKKTDANHWKSIYTVIKSDAIFFHRDKGTSGGNEQNVPIYDEVPLSIKKSDLSEVTSKHKNLFKMRTESGTELLLKAETEQAMQHWVQVIGDLMISSDSKKHRLRKNTASRNRSPASQSPVSKNRKATIEQVPEETTDKDGKKTWKGKVAKQWKKIQGTPPLPLAPYPEGGSIGVPLEECPRSQQPGCEKIPLLVQVCCSVVEERGLEIVGIYRVPGNSAAVNYLTEQVNRGEEHFKLDDPRWSDVNVVSSLIKSFFRKLPDPLFTSEMYSMFIEVSKIEDSLSRLNALKRLVLALPELNFETLKFVSFHLTKVIENCQINKMELRNLAIVFGPTLVRTSDDNMLSMITDMAQQCRIIESILSNVDWFFNPESSDLQESQTGSDIVKLTADTEITQTGGHQSLLLTNLQKLEGSGKVASPNRDIVSAKDIVSGIISAANQKMLRANKTKKDSLDSVGNLKSRDKSPASRRYSEAILHGAVAMADSAARLIEHDYSMTSSMYDKPVKASPMDQLLMVKTESAPHLMETRDFSVMPTNTTVDRSESVPPLCISENVEDNDADSTLTEEKEDPEPDYSSPIYPFHDNNFRALIESEAETLEPEIETQSKMDHQNNSLSYTSVYDNNSYRSLFKSESVPRQLDQRDSNASSSYTPVYDNNVKSSLSPYNTKWSPKSSSIEMLTTLNGMQALCDDKDSVREKVSSTHSRFLSQNYLTSAPNVGFNLASSGQSNELFVTDPNRLENDDNDKSDVVTKTKDQDKIISLTANFDEKLRILLDPHYQTSQSSSSSLNAVSDFRFSVGEKPTVPNRKPDLKRNRGFEKPKEPLSLQRNNSLTKKEKQEINARKKEAAATATSDGTPLTSGATAKQLKTLENNRRIKRRHTVGGTKDIPLWGKENYDSEVVQNSGSKSKLCCRESSPEILTIKQELRSSSPPDLSITNNRRLSLPDPV